MEKKLTLDNVAKIIHQAVAAYNESLGDFSLTQWEQEEEWAKASARQGVLMYLKNPKATPEQNHENWCEFKTNAGWNYGEVKDPKRMTHPCLVPWEDLPEEQKVKDEIFLDLCAILVPMMQKPPAPKKKAPPPKVNPADAEALEMDEESKKPAAPKKKRVPSGK